MQKSISLIEIEQIYNFIAEYPEILAKNNFDRVLTFISAYHYDRSSIIGLHGDHGLEIHQQGHIKVLDLTSAPNFLHKHDFLSWCTNHLLN
ncbi:MULTISPECIES: hypothetical protein [unclassified Acinetobacter]|uniref:hypothetical protein n=1 Tax=unclassified Acinetobacter TaxID=196816 RepID=UPI0029350197|nr:MULTISPECIES: hypothetical protein [unclassified Acinetobacter]WOE31908.1 hypothetical protein QSG84_01400 [Acinetobacter sp. SAAs470]WOE37375.1 hypothetical protein QSG86_10445 [Acinetobacter sp. SAAs474]